FGILLMLVDRRQHLLHHFRMSDQVVLDDAFDLLTLVGRERLRRRRHRRSEKHCGRQRNGNARDQAHTDHPFRGRDLRNCIYGPICSGFFFTFLLNATISSARTQPGEPIGKRCLARSASARAVLLSPRANAAWAEARSASARSFLRPYAIASWV